MKRYWEQLKPNERRWVAGIGLVLFVLINWLFVTPHFSDWGKANARIQKAQDLMNRYGAELKNKPTYEAKMKALQSGGGPDVPQEEQAIDIVRFYNSRADSNGVQVLNNSRPNTRTNDPFFVDHVMSLSVQGRESHIVNFLYSLGAGSSIVRVRSMSLHPDPTHQQITANIDIVASYAKKIQARTPAAAPASIAKTEAPAAKPAPQTNKPLVAVTHNKALTNKPAPMTKRP